MAKQNLKGATKRSQYEAKVKQLDNLGTPVNQFIQQEGFSLIESILGDFVQRVKENIDKEDMPVSGKISDITIQAEGNQVNVYAYPYLLFQDRGCNGAEKKLYNTPHAYTNKMPPVQVFKDWIKRKNINLKDNAKFRGEESPFKELTEEQQINKAAWGMAKKVYKEGFKPRNIYSKELPQLLSELEANIEDFAIQSIINAIDVKPQAKRQIIKK